jgi:hypothetical protein
MVGALVVAGFLAGRASGIDTTRNVVEVDRRPSSDAPVARLTRTIVSVTEAVVPPIPSTGRDRPTGSQTGGAPATRSAGAPFSSASARRITIPSRRCAFRRPRRTDPCHTPPSSERCTSGGGDSRVTVGADAAALRAPSTRDAGGQRWAQIAPPPGESRARHAVAQGQIATASAPSEGPARTRRRGTPPTPRPARRVVVGPATRRGSALRRATTAPWASRCPPSRCTPAPGASRSACARTGARRTSPPGDPGHAVT